MKNRNTLDDMRQVHVLTKYGILGLVALFTAHCALLVIGYDALVVHVIAVVFALYLGMRLSVLFGLCWVHRLGVLYVCMVLGCIVMRRHDLWGCWLMPARCVMTVLGVTVLILAIWKTGKGSC